MKEISDRNRCSHIHPSARSIFLYILALLWHLRRCGGIQPAAAPRAAIKMLNDLFYERVASAGTKMCLKVAVFTSEHPLMKTKVTQTVIIILQTSTVIDCVPAINETQIADCLHERIAASDLHFST